MGAITMGTPGVGAMLSSPAAAPAAQLIMFSVEQQVFALRIAFAREVQAWSGVCWLPGMPDFVRGVINLRGVVIPVIDLRALFSHGLTEAGDEHVVVVIVIEQKRFGILVDDVSDIISVEDNDLQPLPNGTGSDGDNLLTNIVMHGEQMLYLLDAHRVVGAAGFR